MEPQRLADAAFAVAGVPDDLKFAAGPEQGREPHAHDGMVVDQKYGYPLHGFSSLSGFCSLIVTTAFVPRPGALSNAMPPAMPRRRSRMP